MAKEEKLPFYEFFAGGGMARLGLRHRWHCTFANDSCTKKAAAYWLNFGEAPELSVRDIREVTPGDLPGEPQLVWASFPCQDLSLAGNGAGLKGERSGTFWPFWKLMQGLAKENRPARLIVLENVVGAITSNRGHDFRVILQTLSDAGYRAGALVIDAIHFVPQSRPRLFILAVDSRAKVLSSLRTEAPNPFWHPAALRAAYAELPIGVRKSWEWWHLPLPPAGHLTLSDIIEPNPDAVVWHSAAETKRLLQMMSQPNREKVEKAKRLRRQVIGTIYRRTRLNQSGQKVQRAEVRFDQISGCLRTPVGGSSRQTVLVVEGETIRSRLLSPREAARLMGVPDEYKLPQKYNEAYHLMGDGLVVPVVQWLEQHLLSPLGTVNDRALEAA